MMITRICGNGSGNTRLIPSPGGHSSESQSRRCFIDYLRYKGTVSPESFNNLVDFILGCDPFWEYDQKFSIGKGCVAYSNKVTELDGAVILFNYLESGNIDLLVEVSGSVIEQNFSLANVFNYNYALLNKFGLKCTRIDIAIDDFDYGLPWQQIENALVENNYSGFRKANRVQSFTDSGITYYLGSRESSSCVRIYDTEVKHGYSAQRFEVEFKRAKASVLAQLLASTPDKKALAYSMIQDEDDSYLNYLLSDIEFADILQRKLASFALGSISFIDRAYECDDGSLGDCPELEFWSNYKQKILDGTFACSIRCEAVKPSIVRSINFLKRQCAKTFYKLRAGMKFHSNHLMDRIIEKVHIKLSEKDKAEIRYLQTNPEIFAFV